MAHLATFAGCIYVAPVNEAGEIIDESGNPSKKWYFLGEVAPLSIQLQDEDPITIKGRTCITYGKTIASKAQPGNATGTLTMHEYTAQNVARALKGMLSSTQSSTEQVSETVELGGVGDYIEIGAKHLSGYTVTGSGSAALVESTDYVINPTLGLIAAANSTTANQSVTVSAQSQAPAQSRIVIGANTAQKYAIQGLLINEFSGAKVEVYLRKVLFSSSAEIVLVSEDGTEHEAINMTITPEIPNGQTDYGTIDGLPIQ